MSNVAESILLGILIGYSIGTVVGAIFMVWFILVKGMKL